VIIQDDDDVQEVVVPIKAEPREQSISRNTNLYSKTSTIALFAQEPDESIVDFQGYQNYENDHEFENVSFSTIPIQDGNIEVERTGGGREDEFEDFLKQNSGQIEGGTWSCYLCGKITNGSGNMRQHFEAYHFSLGGFQCEHCMKLFKTKHSLATHVSKKHRN
jgi:hypothetical protein